MCGYGPRVFLTITTSFPHGPVSTAVSDDFFRCNFQLQEISLDFFLGTMPLKTQSTVIETARFRFCSTHLFCALGCLASTHMSIYELEIWDNSFMELSLMKRFLGPGKIWDYSFLGTI